MTGIYFDRDAIYRANTTVSGPPAQETVDESGNATGEENATDSGTYVDWMGAGQGGGPDASVMDLPHPATRPLSPGTENLEYPDPLAVWAHMERMIGHMEEAFKRVSAAEDISIKRKMRGPLRERNSSTGAGTITVAFDQVPQGEIWLVERYTVRTAGATAIRVFNGDPNDPTNEVDWTSLPENTADNNSPIRLWPGMVLTFVATVPAADTLSVNVQFCVVEVR